MSPPVHYKYLLQKGERTHRGQKIGQELASTDTQCGFWIFRPAQLQPCASIGCFSVYYSLAGLMTSTLSVYVTSQITTLERQFGFSSKQTGLILAANDIGYLVCVLFISYSAARMHIPRTLGLTTIMFGISGILCSIPHFLFGSQVYSGSQTATPSNVTSVTPLSFNKPAVYGDLCQIENTTQMTCGGVAGQKGSSSSPAAQEYIATWSIVIIMLGMMLQGFGKAPRGSFTVTYIDNNSPKVKTGFYMGVVATVTMMGPALAFTMGGVFSRMYVTLQPTNLHPGHPRWIGAWWLGYVVFGCVALLVGLPLFCFPKRMPSPDGQINSSQRTTTANGQQMVSNDSKPLAPASSSPQEFVKVKRNMKSLLKLAKGFGAALLRLWTNPVYMLQVCSTCFLLFGYGGASAYGPKYMESVFDLPAYKANYIMAGQSLCAASLGTFIGGYMSKKLKMNAIKALRFVLIVQILSFLSTGLGIFFKCDQPTVQNWPGSEEPCNGECNCQDNSYFPICGANGQTYYSPCQAGCERVTDGVYSNCTCIPGSTAISNMCNYGCVQLYPLIAVGALRGLVGTLGIIPNMLVQLRCVADKDKSLGMGFSSFMTSLLGWLLGPIVFGHVIDGICKVWDVKCGLSGRCLLYDNDMFRIKLHAYIIIAMGCSVLCVLASYIYARYTKCLDDPAEAKVSMKKGGLELVAVQKDEINNNDSEQGPRS